jgi:NHLM bacteriocin system ABC transporter ATP-binding protein
VEVYLVGAHRRRLIAMVADGEPIFPTGPGPLSLALVAAGDARLEPMGPGDPAPWFARMADYSGLVGTPVQWPSDAGEGYALLAARFDELDAEHDRQLIESLSVGPRDSERQPGSIWAALTDAAAVLGVDLAGQAAPPETRGFEAIAAMARIAGLRAAEIRLHPAWWRDDLGGPLIVRAADGATTAIHWARGAWRDRRGEPLNPQGVDSRAVRVFPPLAHDLSRFGGMARDVLAGLRSEIWLIAGAGLGAALAGLVTPLATAWVFDDIVPSGAGGLLIAAGVALLAAGLLTAAFSVVRALAVARVAGRGQARMAAGVADRVLRLPARFFKSMSAPDLNQRLAHLEQIRTLITGALLNASVTLGFAAVYLVLMFVYEPRVALAALALTLVHGAAVAISRMAQIGPLREAAEREGRLASLTFEILEGLPKLRSAAAEARIVSRWRDGYAGERAATARGERIAAHFAAFADSWRIVTLMGIFAVAILLVARDLRPGVFIAFLVAFATFQASFAAFCESLMSLYAARPYAERARAIFTAPSETGLGRADPGRLTGDIQVSGVSFAYAEGGALLLDGLGFSIRPGEHLAIVGGSGSGKSTILRLLLGFERPRTGAITYDGQELSSLDPARVRAQIGVVLQSSQLFSGSINDNIRGASGASLEQCRIAAERAGLGPDLKQMPMGLHTPITEGSATVSGGQRQRILIARAIVSEPAILFFDEATSALDNATQAVVARTLDGLQATRVTIAHRLSTVRKADRICVLERGRFVETGSYDELMARNGAFAALSRRQLLED